MDSQGTHPGPITLANPTFLYEMEVVQLKKEELKKRASLLDERTVNLFKRYPLVGVVVVIAGFVLGFVVGRLI